MAHNRNKLTEAFEAGMNSGMDPCEENDAKAQKVLSSQFHAPAVIAYWAGYSTMKSQVFQLRKMRDYAKDLFGKRPTMQVINLACILGDFYIKREDPEVVWEGRFDDRAVHYI